jgi:hypothetical protein
MSAGAPENQSTFVRIGRAPAGHAKGEITSRLMYCLRCDEPQDGRPMTAGTTTNPLSCRRPLSRLRPKRHHTSGKAFPSNMT